MHRPLATKREIVAHLDSNYEDEDFDNGADRMALLNHLVNDHWVGGPKADFPQGTTSNLRAEHAKLHALDILALDVPFAHEQEFDTLSDFDQVAHFNEHGYNNATEVMRWHRDFRFKTHDELHGFTEGMRRITQDPGFFVGPTSVLPFPKELSDFAGLARASGLTVVCSAEFDESGHYIMRVTASVKQEESE